MRDTVCAAAVVARADGSLQLDPCAADERATNSAGLVTVALLPSENRISLLDLQGQVEFEQAKQAIELAMDGCASIRTCVKAGLLADK